MLKKIYRITKDREYQTIFRRGRYQQTAFFNINYLPNRFGLTRIGIVVTKKVAKKAVERNLLKRRVRELAQSLHPKTKQGYDIVIVIKKADQKTTFAQLQEDLKKAFEKASLMQ